MLLAGSSGVALASRALCSATPIGCASLARCGRPANASAAQLAAGRPAKSPPTAAVPRNFRRCIVISLSSFAAIKQQVGDLRAPARLVGQRQRVEIARFAPHIIDPLARSEEHTSELQSLMRTSYAVSCLKKQHHTYT